MKTLTIRMHRAKHVKPFQAHSRHTPRHLQVLVIMWLVIIGGVVIQVAAGKF